MFPKHKLTVCNKVCCEVIAVIFLCLPSCLTIPCSFFSAILGRVKVSGKCIFNKNVTVSYIQLCSWDVYFTPGKDFYTIMLKE